MSTSRLSTCKLHPYCNKLRREGKYSDVIIKVEDRTFPCHRIILASALEYFRSMFSDNFNEATQKEVEIKGVSADDFELLLTHIYGGSVDLEGDNVYRLLRISNFVGLETLSTICEEYVIKNKETISLDTVLDVFVFASKLERTSLVNELAGRLAQDFDVVAMEEKLFSISKTAVENIFGHLSTVENPMPILEFMDHWGGLHPTDIDVFDSWLLEVKIPSYLCEWIKDKLKRKKKKKISSTDENKTDGKTGSGTLEAQKEPVFYSESMDCEQLLSVVRPEISLYCQLREATGNCYRFDFDTKSNRIRADGTGPYYESMKTKTMTFLKSVRTNPVHILLAGHNFEIASTTITPYICNPYASLEKYLESHHFYYKGINSSSQIAGCGTDVFLYNDGIFLSLNAELGQLTSLHRYPPRQNKHANLISYENNLYILGGKCLIDADDVAKLPPNDHRKFEPSENGMMFERLDPRAGTFSKLPNMHRSNIRPSSCVYKDNLYVTGGENVSYFEGLVQCFDFKAGKWRIFEKRMPKQKQNHTVIGYDDRLYFFGGDDDLTWYSYDLKDEVWSDVLSIPQKRGSVMISKILDAEVL